jgi:hypothetical protein
VVGVEETLHCLSSLSLSLNARGFFWGGLLLLAFGVYSSKAFSSAGNVCFWRRKKMMERMARLGSSAGDLTLQRAPGMGDWDIH